jgi:hypothetical protein
VAGDDDVGKGHQALDHVVGDDGRDRSWKNRLASCS